MTDTTTTRFETFEKTLTHGQRKELTERSSLTGPDTPGLERANRRYRLVITLEPIFTGRLRRSSRGMVGSGCPGVQGGSAPLGSSMS
jgi:hypothetical protein